MNDQFYFAPDEDCLTPLLAAVTAAEQSILIADYSFNLPQLTDLVIAKAAAGVKVRMVLDRSQSIGKNEALCLQKLKAANIDFLIGTSDRHQIMHLKVAVIDNETTIFGSYNFTTNAASQDNVLAVFPDADLAADFTTHIQSIYAWILANEPQGDKLILGKDFHMTTKDITHYIEIFVGAFVTFLASSGLNLFNLPSDTDLKKLALAAAVAGVVAVYQQIIKPGAVALKAQFTK